jgi:hypothetical protein
MKLNKRKHRAVKKTNEKRQERKTRKDQDREWKKRNNLNK